MMFTSTQKKLIFISAWGVYHNNIMLFTESRWYMYSKQAHSVIHRYSYMWHINGS